MKAFTYLSFFILLACGFSACQESEDIWDPYQSWRERNDAWFIQVADSARSAISEARTLYGNDWEAHCSWRMFKTLTKSQDINNGKLSDSICVRILSRGDESGLVPFLTDTVRVSFRAWLMPTQFRADDGSLFTEATIFTQTYYGDFSPLTAAPVIMSVGNTVPGYSTALQYMHEGDDWLIYIPADLAYAEKEQDAIPAYSTLLYRMHLTKVYRAGGGVPSWKARQMLPSVQKNE